MSVVPMKKVRILTHRDEVSSVLETTQKFGAMEFHQVGEIAEIDRIEVKPEAGTGAILTRLAQAVSFLSNYEAKKGTLAKLKEGTLIELTEAELKTKSSEVDLEIASVLDESEAVHADLVAINEKLRNINEAIDTFSKWKALSIPLSSLNTKYTATYLLQIKDIASNSKLKSGISLQEQLTSSLQLTDLKDYEVENVDTGLASITVYKTSDSHQIVSEVLKNIGAEFVQLPTGNGTVAEEIAVLNEQVKALEVEKATVESKATNLTNKHLSNLRVAHDVYVWKNDCQETLKSATATKRVVVFEGWCDANELENLRSGFKQDGLTCEMEEITPAQGEEPPVELKNNSLVQPFEIITRLYGLPTHKDLDPTPFLAGFFFLFFGLSLTDVGYGVFLMAVALLVLFYFKVSSTVKLFGKLLFLMGLSSALVGVVFGGYLGIDASKLPDLLQKLQQFDPIGNPLPVFYLALALGVVQVMFGMMLKIYSDARNNQLLNGVLDQGPWLLLFASLILYGVAGAGYVGDMTSEAVLPLIYISLVVVVVASGRNGKGIFGKIQMSLLSLYNSIGYFSDILSYSRLLALGLATSALAFAVNLIADIVKEMIPYVGAIFAILILVVGHLFTLVVNTLGAFIHSARLQFVEFFGKFISGTGRTFKPLNRKESYVTIVKDSG